jgi:hypothetical protein
MERDYCKIGSVEIGGTERGGCELRAGKEPFWRHGFADVRERFF